MDEIFCNKSTITEEEVYDYFHNFSSPVEAYNDSSERIDSFCKDVETLVKSMSNLYQEDKVPLAINDVYVEVNFYARGGVIMQATIGHKE